MTSAAEDKAALNVGVTAAANPQGIKGILYRATPSTSNTALTLPMRDAANGDRTVPIAGKWINFYASDVSLQYAFGVSAAPTLTYNQDVTIGTGHVAAGATIPAGQIVAVIVPSDARFLSVICSGTTGKIEIYVSEQPG